MHTWRHARIGKAVRRYTLISRHALVGNIKETTLSDIWENSEKLKEWREKAVLKIDKCEKCYLKSKCTRCPGLAYMEDGDLYGCSMSAKRIAENR